MTKKPAKDIYGSDLLPEGVCLNDIKDKIKDTDAHYTKAIQRMRILDGADRGKVWDVVRAKFPSYQLTPDTNWVNYIKENLVASIYTTGRYAELVPKSDDDVEYCNEFNAAFLRSDIIGIKNCGRITNILGYASKDMYISAQ